MAVTLDDMRPKLLTLDSVRETLAASEPLGEHSFQAAQAAKFQLGSAWATKAGDDDPADAYFTTPLGQKYQLTRNSVLEAGAQCGIPRVHQQKIPAGLLQAEMNWWFREGFADREFKLLAHDRGDKDPLALAMCRGTISPFSNVSILDAVLEGIEAKYGPGEVLADYKFHHSLERTDLRLIVPGHVRVINGSSLANDTWCTGLQIKNSLIGLKQTRVDGYLFRWWCTNGSIDTLASSGGLKRISVTSPAEAYEWARKSVDSVLGGLEGSMDAVEALTQIPVGADVTLVLADLFTQYKIPVREQNRVIAFMADNPTHNMYELMQAITRTANSDGLPPAAVEQLMVMGGHTAHAAMGRCDGHLEGGCKRLLPDGYVPPVLPSIN